MFLHARNDSCIIPQPSLCLTVRDFLYASVIYQIGIWCVVPVLDWIELSQGLGILAAPSASFR